MTEETKQHLETITAPYGREVRLDEVHFDSGMQLLRITVREGHRFTILDVDPATALTWADTMKQWAERATPSE